MMEPVPPADMKEGFFSLYIIVPKKSGGLRPILGLRILNWAFHKPLFKMLMQNRIFGCIRPQVWSAASDLKDPYFHVSILPRHRPFLQFAFEGRAYQYKVLPFGLSLSPRVFTKVAEAALVPLREQGVRILNYLDDWLILVQSQDQLCEHRDLVLSHLSQLGLRVNWEKSKLLPTQRISFPGMEFGFGQSDSVPHTGNALSRCWTAWIRSRTGRQHHWNLQYTWPWTVKRRLRGEHILVRTDSTATVAYINQQGGLCSRCMSQLARHLLLLWSQKHLRSLRAIHILGLLNRTADKLSRAALPGEWRLCPQTVQLIWRCFGLAQLDLFASLETFHCQLFYSLTEGTLGTDTLAHSWHCARSGRKRSSSCSWHHTGPPGLGSQSWCSSWQPLPGRFLWGRIYCLRDGAPCGTRVQTSGNFMSGPWTGRGGSRWPTPRGSLHHHFGANTVY